jgi:hypothetical protein
MEPMHTELAQRYFATLARRFPVMCASDEFLFLPRAQAAALHYDQMDDFDADAIGQCLADLKGFHSEFGRRAATAPDLEARIDLELLQANVCGLLIELEDSLHRAGSRPHQTRVESPGANRKDQSTPAGDSPPAAAGYGQSRHHAGILSPGRNRYAWRLQALPG